MTADGVPHEADVIVFGTGLLMTGTATPCPGGQAERVSAS